MLRQIKFGSRNLRAFSTSPACVYERLKTGPFQVYDEYKVFETLLTNRFHSRDDLPYLDHIKKLRRIEQTRKTRRLDSNVRKLGGLLNKDSNSRLTKFGDLDKIKAVLAKHVTTSDIDGFLRIRCANFTHDAAMVKYLNSALQAFIEQSSEQSLPVITELLTVYWSEGFEGARFGDLQARRLVTQVLDRALEVYPRTVYTPESHEISVESGCNNFDAFRQFVDIYLDEFGTTSSAAFQDLLLQLAAKSRDVDTADVMLDLVLANGLPSAEAIEQFTRALTGLIQAQRAIHVGDDTTFTLRIKRELESYRNILTSEQITPTVVEFLLLWTSTLDEVYSVLELVTQSKFEDQILAKCQLPILNAVVKVGLQDGYGAAMAHMFGVLNRFNKCSAQITPDAYDECLLLCATYGNSPGMYRAISMKQSLDNCPNIPKEVISQVLDRLPTIDGEMAKEKQASDSWWLGNSLKRGEYSMDQAVLHHLRQQIEVGDAAQFERYLAAVGRFGMPSLLQQEWTKLDGKVSRQPQEVVVAFIGAFKAIGDFKTGIKVLEAVLQTSIDHHDGQAISILRRVLRYEILPPKQIIPFVANWLIKHKRDIQWTAQDIEQTFEEIAHPSSISSLTENEQLAARAVGKAVAEAVVRVQGGKDVDDSIAYLNQLFVH